MSLSQHESVFRERRIWVTFAVTALFCLLIAGFLWALIPSMGQYPFTDVLAHSMSIGLLAAVLTILVVRWLGPSRSSSLVWLTFCLIPVSLTAYVIGSSIARLIVGVPVASLVSAFESDDTISLATTVVATALCAGFFISRDQLNRLKLQAAEDGKRAESAKLAMLQAQVEPHMLFNTLANLRALIGADPDRAIVMLDQLDGFLRTTLQGSRSPTNSLGNEFVGLEHYLSIMQIRLGDRLTYTLDLPAALAQLQVPSLLLQPVVENAVRHGIEPKVGGGQITVRARLEKQMLTMEVTDTGVGLNPPGSRATSRQGGGFGLQSLRERLPDIGGKSAVQVISPAPGGTAERSGTTILMKVLV